MIKKKYANQARLRRHQRVRKKVSGTTARPRLSVFRSQNQIYAQIVDDERQTTMVAASSRDPELAKLSARAGGQAAAEPKRGRGAKAAAQPEPAPSAPAAEDTGEETDVLGAIAANRRVAQARLVGKLIAQRAKAAGIEKVVFDRGGYIYHGRVAALATGAREGGLDF